MDQTFCPILPGSSFVGFLRSSSLGGAGHYEHTIDYDARQRRQRDRERLWILAVG